MTDNQWKEEMAKMWKHIEESKAFLNMIDGLHEKWSAAHESNCECKKEGGK